MIDMPTRLQIDIGNMMRWCDINKLPLNFNKCHIFTASRAMRQIRAVQITVQKPADCSLFSREQKLQNEQCLFDTKTLNLNLSKIEFVRAGKYLVEVINSQNLKKKKSSIMAFALGVYRFVHMFELLLPASFIFQSMD